MADTFDSNNPEEVYEKKDLQKDFVQIFSGDELIAVVIPYIQEEEEISLSEVTEGDNPEDTDNGTINVSEIIDKASKVNLDILKEDKDLTPEEKNKKLKELREKLLEEENNYQDPESKSLITRAKRTVTKVYTIGR